MAETDMKALSELDLYNELLDANSLLPMTVRPSGSNITRKVYYPALKTQIAGYYIVGTLTAGNTSITLSSVGFTYDPQTAYTAGDRVTNTIGETVKNFICIESCAKGTWETNSQYFVEYTPISAASNIDVYTKVGDNPYVATPVVACTLAQNSVALTFTAQSSDILVKIRVT